MPPIPRQRRPLSYDDPALSDEDVGLIFQVITFAEADPEVKRLPYRALFRAYDQVIEEHGVDADPSYACMRFLLKMGNKNVVGNDLYEKFENLLEQVGIVLEIGTNDDEGNEFTYAGSVSSIDRRPRKNVPPADDTTQATPRRRASFNSMYDVGDDPTQRSLLNRPSSRSSMSRLPVGKPEFLDPDPDSRPSPGRATAREGTESPDRTQLIAQFLDVGRRLMYRMEHLDPNNETGGQPAAAGRGRRARSAVDKDRSVRMVENAMPRIQSRDSHPLGSSEDDEGADEESSVSSQNDHDSVGRVEVASEMLYRPSLSDLLRDASTFNMYRQRAINRKILAHWVKKAVQARQSHRHMELVAVNRDSLTLMRQAFETWHSIIRTKRRAVQTERFFKHLEERAGRARDLYLLTKAFSHWAQVTSDEMAKTSAARRHILGVKYFSAWREITAVNEMKAQRFALPRPFHTWQQKVRRLREMEETAEAARQASLKHNFYWQWFWGFCERRAPQWYDYRLKRRSLLSWLRKFRTNRERYHEIVLNDKRDALGSALQAWSERFKTIAGSEQQAVSLHCGRILEETYAEWRVQTRLAPAARQVSSMVDQRILHTAYAQWVTRVQMVHQAKEMDQRRILRNAWTKWNDLLRCQALNARIEERIKLETMYKWILAERYRLMQRIREARIKREVFARFVTNTRRTYTRLLDRAEAIEESRNEDLLRSRFNCWRDKLALQRQREIVAFEFYAPRLVQESLVAWRSKAGHGLRLEEWARDARFYFLATKTVKHWYAASLVAAKRRRQDAYAKTRRMVKVHLASSALNTWSARARHVANMEQKALEFWRRRTMNTASGVLVRWRGETDKRVQECDDAEVYRARQVAYDQLTHWVEKLISYQRMEKQADDVYRLHSLPRANTQFRKLSLRIFQISSHYETADALHERNFRKHVRGAFRNWLEKARMQLEARDSPGPLLSPSKATTNGHLEGPSIFDPWSPIGTPFKNMSTTFVPDSQGPSAAPFVTPNDMTSPSKRAARAKAFAQASTTPATPLYTPFASRLRLASEGRPLSSLRGRSGRGNSLGANVRFVDEEPMSPSEGRKSGGRRT
ncbi:Sfi1-domain-containing protein [Aspergillus taichungensis]|uniref:Sfi1-domain-containing protein n=1 Tax=Aspergillus taichungensis TaxID=482145 RepID=A0A2J5HM33_9EURO|nr:Sfi1-domain-containing protein [Aspergillus taichungensis]